MEFIHHSTVVVVSRCLPLSLLRWLGLLLKIFFSGGNRNVGSAGGFPLEARIHFKPVMRSANSTTSVRSVRRPDIRCYTTTGSSSSTK